jgi:hypothetical protein
MGRIFWAVLFRSILSKATHECTHRLQTPCPAVLLQALAGCMPLQIAWRLPRLGQHQEGNVFLLGWCSKCLNIMVGSDHLQKALVAQNACDSLPSQFRQSPLHFLLSDGQANLTTYSQHHYPQQQAIPQHTVASCKMIGIASN